MKNAQKKKKQTKQLHKLESGFPLSLIHLLPKCALARDLAAPKSTVLFGNLFFPHRIERHRGRDFIIRLILCARSFVAALFDVPMESFRLLLSAFVLAAGLTTWSAVVHCALPSKMSGGRLNDASDVTWAHAVNSWEALEKALAGPVDFLEADISLGHVIGKEQTPAIPIMAHPPDVTSDISLDTWLGTVLKHAPQKGLKLDFKSIDVVEPSLIVLEKYVSNLNGSLWLSADILPGPVSPRMTPLPADQFLALCYKYFPRRATLLLGWTTNWIRRYPTSSWMYDWKHVRQMADAVRCSSRNKRSTVTFSVRAIYVPRSVTQLRWLLKAVPGSTLYVWTGQSDRLNVEDVLQIQKAFRSDEVFYDLPASLYRPYKSSKLKVKSKKSLDSASWVSVTRDKTCEAFTYIDEGIVLFGRPSDSAVLQKSLIPADGSRNFTLSGRLKFFAGDYTINPTHWEHKLKVVFADVNKLSKYALSYSKRKLTYNVREPEVLWKAVNSSVLYTFEHRYFQDSTACRMFRVDFKANLSFEAWTIPCDVTFDSNTYEEVAQSSIPEVRLEESFEGEEGIFMIGFHSYGEEHVLLYDIDIVTQIEEEKETVFDVPKLQLALTSSKAKLELDLLLIITPFLPLLVIFQRLFRAKDAIETIY